MTQASGKLVLVVGPSGAGKDSVLRGAAEALKSQPKFLFPRRVITRTADITAEDHDSLSQQSFETIRAAGGFLFSWEAHGNSYGIPVSVSNLLASGHVVAINVSRQIISDAAAKIADLCVIEITADAALRVERIEQRGREAASVAQSRASREVDAYPVSVTIHQIENNGTLDAAVQRFVGLLQSL